LRTIGLSAHDLKVLARVRTEDRDEPIVIRGRLPSSEAVRRFIEEADPDLARKVGAHASSLLVEALGSPLESRLAIRTSPRPRGSWEQGPSTAPRP
jgi:hypothetical protein